jgi:hypothetical protein
MRALFLFITGLFFCQLAQAQVLFPESTSSSDTVAISEITVDSIQLLSELDLNQDSRLDKMLKWHIEYNRRRDGMDGYRIEIFSSSALNGKEQALKKKVEFLSLYPDVNVYVKFRAPVFKVRIGDFRTKKDAMKLYNRVRKNYPGAFIVPDIINFPVLKTNKYERPD